jgi:branched-chain amino acid transport system ATP-binding protein
VTAILDAQDVTLRFGGVTSLDRVDLAVERGTIAAVIGPNGAGKTSLFNCVAGAYTPQQGRLLYAPRSGDAAHDLRGLPPSRVSRLGIARTFQNIRLFGGMTVLENVEVAVETRQPMAVVGGLVGAPWARKRQKAARERARRLLDAVDLAHRAGRVAATLPYGEQRRLEIARALGGDPQLLLLDEPAAGTNPTERNDLVALIKRVHAAVDILPGREEPLTVLLIEHDIGLVSAVASHVTVLNFGRVIASGSPDDVRADRAVIDAYLGTGDDDAVEGGDEHAPASG